MNEPMRSSVKRLCGLAVMGLPAWIWLALSHTGHASGAVSFALGWMTMAWAQWLIDKAEDARMAANRQRIMERIAEE